MIPDFSIKIEFKNSRSKYFREVVRLCRMFDEFTEGERNVLKSDRDEVFEKWEQFNLVFWKTVDWKGSVLEHNGIRYQAHADKTRIFYAVQTNRLTHVCKQVQMIKSIRGAFPVKYFTDLTSEDFMQICN